MLLQETKRILLALLVVFPLFSLSQTPTMGLLQADQNQSFIGYTLFSPMSSNTTYLVDNCGKKVQEWQADRIPGLTSYLRNDGSLLRAGLESTSSPFNTGAGRGGRLQIYDWDGSLIWDYSLLDSIQIQHHDLIPLPNGHVMALVWERQDYFQSVQAGRNPALLNQGQVWSEKIIELRPILPDSAEIVWEWKAWDHLIQEFDSSKSNFGVVSEHPELLDINFIGSSYGDRDWLHANGIDYNPELDQILISFRNLDEIYIIDHSTTTAEAAGHSGGRSGKGGDFLFRWGNDVVHHHDYFADRSLFGQHNPNWIPAGYPDAGKIVVFNNGCLRPGGDYSEVFMLDPQVDSTGNYLLLPDTTYYPDQPFWKWTASVPEDFFAKFISGAQALPNGNVLISEGTAGRFREITRDGETVWDYRNPDCGDTLISQGDSLPPPTATFFEKNRVFRAARYPVDHPAFLNRFLSPSDPVEANPWPDDCQPVSRTEFTLKAQPSLFPNPTQGRLSLLLPSQKTTSVFISNALGQVIFRGEVRQGAADFNLQDQPRGMYWMHVEGFRPVAVSLQ